MTNTDPSAKGLKVDPHSHGLSKVDQGFATKAEVAALTTALTDLTTAAGNLTKAMNAQAVIVADLKAKAHTHVEPIPVPPDQPPPPSDFPYSSLQQAIATQPSGATLDCTGHTFTESAIVVQRPILIRKGTVDAKGMNHWMDVWAPDVVIDGTTFLNAQNKGYHTGGIVVSRPRFRLLNAKIVKGGYSGVQLWPGSTFAVIMGSDFAGSVLGVIGYNAHDAIVESNRFYDHRGSADIGNESGGLKMADSKNVTLRLNKSLENEGPGLWLDGNCPGAFFDRNDTHDNSNSGIMLEISPDGRIIGNVSYRNGFVGGKAFERQSNIFISSCANVRVEGNTAAWVKEPSVPDILFVSQPRDDSLAYNPRPRIGNVGINNFLRASALGIGFQAYPADPNMPVLTPNYRLADTDPKIAALR